MARKILLADDSVTAQNMGRKILADAGYEVLTVNNGSAALKKITEAKPELIVLDVYMPGYSGLEVCQRLKEARETARIPILLTVGKLEPFKPEEAKRAGADAFIVKPFEASELLSALSKLEDKMVPRQESKPGRFARANAALDEARFDKTVAIENDSGWKHRIAFPTKKKKKEAEEPDGDDPAIYNAVNRDLRTTVEHHPPQSLNETPGATPETHEDARMNLEALASEGLPKDVTPEEIAALAAAVAQVKGKISETKTAESKNADSVPEKPVAPAAEMSSTEPQPAEAESASAEAAPEPIPQEAAQPAAEAPPEPPVEPPAPAMASEQGPFRRIEARDISADETIELVSPYAPRIPLEPVAVMPAIDAESPSSGNGTAFHEAVDEPVTMAVAAGAEQAIPPSRWRAVSVSLAPDEMMLSLEQEMQKAMAAFAAADAAQAAVQADPAVAPAEAKVEIAAIPEVVAPMPEPTAVAETPAPVEAPAQLVVPASLGPEMVEAASAVVKEFETVAAPHEGPQPTSPEPDSAHLSSEAVIPPARDIAASTEESTIATATPEAEPAKEIPEPAATPEPEQPAQVQPAAAISPETDDQVSSLSKTETSELAYAAEPQADQSASQLSTGVSEAAAQEDSHAGGMSEMAKRESEIAETTAAAWASWRRIRDTGEAKPADQSKPKSAPDKESIPQDAAAMAVAAGAEKTPEELPANSEGETGEIASIVDSVLADLRPKIVEEISRKLGKKK